MQVQLKIISLSTIMLNVGINRYYYNDAIILGLNEGKSQKCLDLGQILKILKIIKNKI